MTYKQPVCTVPTCDKGADIYVYHASPVANDVDPLAVCAVHYLMSLLASEVHETYEEAIEYNTNYRKVS